MESLRLGRLVVILALAGAGVTANACSLNSAAPMSPADVSKPRLQVVRRAQVWRRTPVSSMNLEAGPPVTGFMPGQTVTCDYVDDKPSGGTPKFLCKTAGGDTLKVKYGRDNGEVFAEVAASRLFWALGFYADAEYPARVVCRGCSEDPWTKRERVAGERVFEYATIERKFQAREFDPEDPGWAWPELDLVDESAGGAPRSQRDALKLLAVFIQHSDTKPEQQRLVCLDDARSDRDAACRQPVMMINDLGVTFGKANNLNRNEPGSTNLEKWSKVPIWKDEKRCVAHLSKSLTGTLEDPVISEAGRRFLADRLAQLRDAQIRDLFQVSRVAERTAKDGEPQGAGVNAWVAAFKAKRDEIAARRCQ